MSSYHAPKRTFIGPPGATGPDPGIVIHEDRGDGTARCAIGTQMGASKPFLVRPGGVEDVWVPLGPGLVSCLLCAESLADAERGGGRRPKQAPADSTQRPLSERTPRTNRSLLGDLPWRRP